MAQHTNSRLSGRVILFLLYFPVCLLFVTAIPKNLQAQAGKRSLSILDEQTKSGFAPKPIQQVPVLSTAPTSANFSLHLRTEAGTPVAGVSLLIRTARQGYMQATTDEDGMYQNNAIYVEGDRLELRLHSNSFTFYFQHDPNEREDDGLVTLSDTGVEAFVTGDDRNKFMILKNDINGDIHLALTAVPLEDSHASLCVSFVGDQNPRRSSSDFERCSTRGLPGLVTLTPLDSDEPARSVHAPGLNRASLTYDGMAQFHGVRPNRWYAITFESTDERRLLVENETRLWYAFPRDIKDAYVGTLHADMEGKAYLFTARAVYNDGITPVATLRSYWGLHVPDMHPDQYFDFSENGNFDALGYAVVRALIEPGSFPAGTRFAVKAGDGQDGPAQPDKWILANYYDRSFTYRLDQSLDPFMIPDVAARPWPTEDGSDDGSEETDEDSDTTDDDAEDVVDDSEDDDTMDDSNEDSNTDDDNGNSDDDSATDDSTEDDVPPSGEDFQENIAQCSNPNYAVKTTGCCGVSSPGGAVVCNIGEDILCPQDCSGSNTDTIFPDPYVGPPSVGGTICGDNVCSAIEKSSCPEDCGPVVVPTPVSTPAPYIGPPASQGEYCGDGKCALHEKNSCKADCGSSPVATSTPPFSGPSATNGGMVPTPGTHPYVGPPASNGSCGYGSYSGKAVMS